VTDADVTPSTLRFNAELANRVRRLMGSTITDMERAFASGDTDTRTRARRELLPFIREALQEKSESEQITVLREELNDLMAEVRAELTPQDVDIPVDIDPLPALPAPAPDPVPDAT
jgi:hypothetical protein